MTKNNTECKITILGDIMMNNTQIPIGLSNGFDCFFSDLKHEFDDCDLVIGNLETPLTDNKQIYSKEKYKFSAPSQMAMSLKKNIPNLVLLTANNHCLDGGVDTLKETIKILDSYEIKHTGTNIDNCNEYLVLDVCNLKISIVNYTYGTNAFSNQVYLSNRDICCVNLLQPQELSNRFYKSFLTSKNIFIRIIRKTCSFFNLFQINSYPAARVSLSKKMRNKYLKMIDTAKANSDVLISCVHIGGQYNSNPTKYTKLIANKTMKHKADVVSCNHEHVVHGILKRKNGLINYSLGNFLGTNGVIESPFDKNSDLSIAINVYIDKKTLKKRFTYSIFKCFSKDGKIVKVASLYKLINESPNDESLIEKNNYVTKTVSKKQLPIMKEYAID